MKTKFRQSSPLAPRGESRTANSRPLEQTKRAICATTTNRTHNTQRPNGPAIQIAQANGLGIRPEQNELRPKGPAVRGENMLHESERPVRWTFESLARSSPGLLGQAIGTNVPLGRKTKRIRSTRRTV